MHRNSVNQFCRVLATLERDPQVRRMEQYTQHKGNPTLRHCHNVAVTSFRMAQRTK